MPWMGLFSLVSLFGYSFSQLADTRQGRWIEKMRKSLANPLRQGVGGGLTTSQSTSEKIKSPSHKEKIEYRGLRTIEHELPIYETRRIQVGLRGVKKKVPQYEQKQIQVGTKTVSTRVPVYKTERVQTGSKLVPKRITVRKYKTTQVLEWKKTTRKVPVYRKVGSRRILIDIKTDIRWKKLPVTKRVPYQETITIYQQIPVYGEKKVLTGYRTESKQVPQYETRNLLVGYKTITESEPVYEMRQIQVGTKTVTRQVPDYEIVKVPLLESQAEENCEYKVEKNLLEESDIDLTALAEGRDYELTEPIFLKGGPGAKSYGLKAEDGWSQHQYGAPSTPLMKGIGLLSNILVWIRDNTNILKLMGNKPDAKAMIVFDKTETTITIDKVKVMNIGNQSIQVEQILIKEISNAPGPNDNQVVQVYPSEINNITNIHPLIIDPSTQSHNFSFDPLTLDLENKIQVLISIGGDFNRFGIIKHEVDTNHEEK